MCHTCQVKSSEIRGQIVQWCSHIFLKLLGSNFSEILTQKKSTLKQILSKLDK